MHFRRISLPVVVEGGVGRGGWMDGRGLIRSEEDWWVQAWNELGLRCCWGVGVSWGEGGVRHHLGSDVVAMNLFHWDNECPGWKGLGTRHGGELSLGYIGAEVRWGGQGDSPSSLETMFSGPLGRSLGPCGWALPEGSCRGPQTES